MLRLYTAGGVDCSRTSREAWWLCSRRSQYLLIIKTPCRQLPNVHVWQTAALSSGPRQVTGAAAIACPAHHPQETL